MKKRFSFMLVFVLMATLLVSVPVKAAPVTQTDGASSAVQQEIVAEQDEETSQPAEQSIADDSAPQADEAPPAPESQEDAPVAAQPEEQPVAPVPAVEVDTSIKAVDSSYITKVINGVALPESEIGTPSYVPGVSSCGPFGALAFEKITSPSAGAGGYGSIGYRINASDVSAADKNNIGMLYQKYQMPNGDFVDIRLTLVDFGVQNNFDGDDTFYFVADEIGVGSRRNVKINLQFLKPGTAEAFPFTGALTFDDIDYKQGIVLLDENALNPAENYVDGASALYAHKFPDDSLLVYEHDGAATNPGEATYTYSKVIKNQTSIDLAFVIFSDQVNLFDELSAMQGAVIHSVAPPKAPVVDNGVEVPTYGPYFRVTNTQIIPALAPVPVKSVTDTDETGVTDNILTSRNEAFSYAITQRVPAYHKDAVYTNFVLEDTLESYLDVQSIKVVDNANTDVTANFTDSTSAHQVKLEANASWLQSTDFYNKTYTFTITVKIKADHPIPADITIKNTAIVTANDKPQPTNEVTTIYTPPAPPQEPTKRVSDANETYVTDNTLANRDEAFTYAITQNAPAYHADAVWKSFGMQDTLKDYLTVQSIKVTDETGADVTAKFTDKTTGSKVELMADTAWLQTKEFYGHTYTFSVTVKIKDNHPIPAKLVIDNVATVTVDGVAQQTNKVTTTYDPPAVPAPAAGTPKTGDTGILVPVIVLVVCALGVAAVLFYIKKNKSKEQKDTD